MDLFMSINSFREIVAVLGQMESCTVFNQVKTFAKEMAGFKEFLHARKFYQTTDQYLTHSASLAASIPFNAYCILLNVSKYISIHFSENQQAMLRTTTCLTLPYLRPQNNCNPPSSSSQDVLDTRHSPHRI